MLSAPHREIGLYSPFTSHDPRLPADLSDCYTVGISGLCGANCPVLQAGECETQDEMEPALADEQLHALSKAWLRDRLQAKYERAS